MLRSKERESESTRQKIEKVASDSHINRSEPHIVESACLREKSPANLRDRNQHLKVFGKKSLITHAIMVQNNHSFIYQGNHLEMGLGNLLYYESTIIIS